MSVWLVRQCDQNLSEFSQLMAALVFPLQQILAVEADDVAVSAISLVAHIDHQSNMTLLWMFTLT